MPRGGTRVVVVGTVLSLLACSPDSGTTGGRFRTDSGPPSGDAGPPPGDGAVPPTPFPPPLPPPVPPGGDGGMGCVAEVFTAEQAFVPVDIIWIVDSSGSMENEAMRVQENLNAFSSAMDAVDLDYRVVMITTSSFVSVPPPLGTGPRYRLLDRGVDSHESLQALLDEFPRYGDFLRAAATTHFVVVTDDESDLEPDTFLGRMRDLLGKTFVFHAIASERVAPGFTNPTGACVTSTGFPPEGAANPGDRYYQLARDTGGLTFSICTSDWSSLFRDLTTVVAVPTPLPCSYEIPPPPMGMSFDRNRVNVVYTPSSTGAADTIPSVGSSDRCGAEGWYYDDPANPSVILLCPSSCTLLGSDPGGRVNIAYGCATELI